MKAVICEENNFEMKQSENKKQNEKLPPSDFSPDLLVLKHTKEKSVKIELSVSCG